MSAHVATLEVPEDLVQELDATFDAESRSNFVAESLRAALQRHRLSKSIESDQRIDPDEDAEIELRQRRLLKFLESDEEVWKEEDHPEWANGSAEWVRALRQESEKRIPRRDPESSAA